MLVHQLSLSQIVGSSVLEMSRTKCQAFWEAGSVGFDLSVQSIALSDALWIKGT